MTDAMSVFPASLWDRLEDVVKGDRFSGANEEFTDFKTAVHKASTEELASVARHGEVAWQFLLGFAEKKSLYRSHILKVIQRLVLVPAWKVAYQGAAQERLSDVASRLHPDLQEALRPLAKSATSEEVSEAAAAFAPPPRPSAAKPLPRWPDWSVMQATVLMQGFASANDEFSALRQAVREASVDDIEQESGHAKLVWQFLVGFADTKKLYRSQITEVVKLLAAAEGWRAVLLEDPAFVTLVGLIASTAMDADRSTRAASAEGMERQCGANNVSVSTPIAVSTGCDLAARLDALTSSQEHDDVCVDRTDTLVPSRTLLPSGTSVPSGTPGPSNVTEPSCVSGPSGISVPLGSARLCANPTFDSASATPASVVVDVGTCAAAEPTIAAAGSSTPATLSSATPAHGGVPTAATGLSQTSEANIAAGPSARLCLQRASDLDSSEPVIAHYCRVYALELMVRDRKAGRSSSESDALLIATLNESEAKKKVLDLSCGPQTMEAFARCAYQNAVDADGAGPWHATIPLQFYLSSIFLQVLEQFHCGTEGGDGLPRDLLEMVNYARQRAVHLRCCLRSGVQPEAPCPPSVARPTAAATSSVTSMSPSVKTEKQAIAAGATATPAIHVQPGLSRTKRQQEAKKRADQVGAALESGNFGHAAKLIREALAHLDGL